MNRLIILAICFAFTAPAGAAELRTGSTLDRAGIQLLAERQDGVAWATAGYLGSPSLSQYFVMQRWLRTEGSAVKPEALRQLLLGSQQADGSWQALYDASFDGGDLAATISSYWALKVLGEDPESRALSRARGYVLAHGGLDAAPTSTKVFLALTDNYAWSKLPRIPYLLWMPLSPVNASQFASWVGPNLKPLAYLRQVRASRQLGPEYDLKELFAAPPPPFDNGVAYQPVEDAPADHQRHIKSLIADQSPRGDWGDSTTATILSLAAVQDFAARWPLSAPDQAALRSQGLAFLEANAGRTAPRWSGDSALAALALLEAGTPAEELEPTLKFLFERRQEEAKPRVDDTAALVAAASRFPRLKKQSEKATQWLVSRQNQDGGFATFDRDNFGNFMLGFFAGDFGDSMNLYDESSADVTGRVLEALARSGQSRTNSVVVQRAISFLRGAQHGDGSFTGSWGVNTLFGTSAAVVGLVRAGLPVDDGMVVKALDYLASRQNDDGGFGETFRSYVQPELAGRGVSTPTQTSWALLGLLEHRDRFPAQVDRAVSYLLAQFEKDGRWTDSSAVGVAQPGMIPAQQAAFARIYPLLALARYQRQGQE